MNDLAALRYFSSVFRGGSFGATATEFGVSQSTVTKSIQRLEAQLGLKLFNRTTRRVEPTDSARSLAEKADDVLRSAAVFSEEASLLSRGELGGIRIGAIALAAETLIADSLARLAQTHPLLEVEVIVGSSDVYQDLVRGECDVVIGDEANLRSSIHARALRMVRIAEEQLVFVHRDGHPAGAGARLDELLDYPMAVPSRYFNENRLFESTPFRGDTGLSPVYRLNSLSGCLSLAASSDVITLAPATVAMRLIDNGNPPAIAIADADTGISITLTMVTVARNSPSPAIRAFQQALFER